MKACLTDRCQIGKQTKSRTMYSWMEMRHRINSKQSKAFALKQLKSGAPIAETDSKAANSAHKILEPYKATADHYIFSFLILSTNAYVEFEENIVHFNHTDPINLAFFYRILTAHIF